MRKPALLVSTAVALSLTGCGGNEYVNAPDWVMDLAREEAVRLGEKEPDIEFAACGPSTCIVRMLGSFRDDGSRAPRLDLEMSVQSRSIKERAFYYGA